MATFTVLSDGRTIGAVINETNLSGLPFAAALFLAALDALEDGAPLKVHQSDEHQGETEADRDVQRPLNRINFIFYFGNALEGHPKRRG